MLFNGGVFKAGALQQRLMEVLGNWADQDAQPKLLAGEHDLDHAVARGAAYYGWTKERGGVRIRGGVARSYYVGIETAGLAIPGAPRPLRALCVVPFGMEEGTEVDVPSGEIGLVLGEPAHFRFFSSAVRKDDHRARCWNPGRKTSWSKPTRWKPLCRPTRRSTNRMFPCDSSPASPNWARLNCGVSARRQTDAGNWSSVSAKTMNERRP